MRWPVPEPLNELMSFLSGAFRRASPVVGDQAILPECAARVTGNDRLTPAEQVDIYRRQYWLRHIDSLREDYPGLEALLGEEAFDVFCSAYLTAHPPRTPSLRELGDDIVAFAEGYAAFPEAIRAAALSMVRYENAFIAIFDGPEPAPLDPAKVQGLPPEAWETARIVLHPLMARLRLDAPVYAIRRALKMGEAPELPPKAEASCVVLFRKDLRIVFEVLDPLAFELLEALARGEALVPACDRIAAQAGPDRAEELGPQVGTWFQQWTSLGWIIDIAV
jgi:hypothetical protein